jgi:hypothetical protein
MPPIAANDATIILSASLDLARCSIRIFGATCTLDAGLDPFQRDTDAKLVEPWAGRIASRCRCTCKAVEADGAG